MSWLTHQFHEPTKGAAAVAGTVATTVATEASAEAASDVADAAPSSGVKVHRAWEEEDRRDAAEAGASGGGSSGGGGSGGDGMVGFSPTALSLNWYCTNLVT
jgi:hypothetical protein